MLTPPYHFSIVAAPINPDDDCAQILYRGSLPVARNAPFLRRLGIRTLVYLRKKALKDDDSLALWSAKQGIDLQWVQADKMEEESLGMDREHVTNVLKVSRERHGCVVDHETDLAQSFGVPNISRRRGRHFPYHLGRRMSAQAARLAFGLHRQ